MELGIYTFADAVPSPLTGEAISPAQRLRNLIEEIEVADQVGLDNILHAIELFGTKVAPVVRRETARASTSTEPHADAHT